MKILHTVNQAQFDEIAFSFKSSEITDSGIDENEDGTMTSWDRGTVTLSADCHGAELLKMICRKNIFYIDLRTSEMLARFLLRYECAPILCRSQHVKVSK